MKNYSMDNDKIFILNYEKKDGKIVINYIYNKHKQKHIIDDNIENEKNLLKKMKKQVSNAKKFDKEICTIRVVSSGLLDIGILLLVISSILVLFKPVIFPLLIPGLILTCSSAFMVITSKIKISDLRKNQLYIENENLLNKKILESENIIQNTNVKIKNNPKKSHFSKEIVLSENGDKPKFTINKIDKIKYRELKQILENIKLEEEFKSNDSEEKGKSLTKSMKKE